MEFCRWRKSTDRDWAFRCLSERIEAHEVGKQFCEQCPVVDHEPDPPGIVTKIVNLGTALLRHTKDSLREVTEEEYNGRLAKCEACPFNKRNENSELEWICQHQNCGCQLQIKAKWASESCPIGEWGKIEETKSEQGNCGCRT